jgi:hypothetical protein
MGLVKSKPRGQGKSAVAKNKAAKKSAAGNVGAKAGKRGPGRPRKNVNAAVGSLEGIVAAVKQNEQAMVRYRGALEKIQAVLAGVLA